MLAAGCCRRDKLDQMSLFNLLLFFLHILRCIVLTDTWWLCQTLLGLGNLDLSSLTLQPRCGNTPDSQNWWRWRPTGSIRRLHMALLQGFRWMQRVYTPVDLGSQSEVVERWPITLLLTQLLSNGSQVWCSQLCLRRPLCLVMGGCNCGCAHAACAGWGGWPGGVCLRWMSAGVFSAAQPVVCF